MGFEFQRSVVYSLSSMVRLKMMSNNVCFDHCIEHDTEDTDRHTDAFTSYGFTLSLSRVVESTFQALTYGMVSNGIVPYGSVI
jgi:hypothetical protein